MNRKNNLWYLYLILVAILITCIGSAIINNAATTSAQAQLNKNRSCIIIDAGHGGVDGGATSCTGVLESNLNLQISLKLNELFRLLGYRTKMIRTEDISVFTEGTTIAQKKISDLRERLRIINTTENALLISIHQNYFHDSQYSGAQVFYAHSADSESFAELLQTTFRQWDGENHRSHKASSEVFLMDRINCTGVLVECGFLSNPEEEQKLRDHNYQNKLCCIIASGTALFLDRTKIN